MAARDYLDKTPRVWNVGRNTLSVPVGTSVVTLLPQNDRRVGLILSPPLGVAGSWYVFKHGQDPASNVDGTVMSFGCLPMELQHDPWCSVLQMELRVLGSVAGLTVNVTELVWLGGVS